ncbi:GspE/PulE family protein [Pilimelia columellifera]|uniref:GspE/PulE family protein n=1 Tax=Pilimelia columellifera subsp. columellifera TaxID=706583 RepID=A0ABN3N726_9ACTN
MNPTFYPLLDALRRMGVDPVSIDQAVKETERSGRTIRDVLINDHIVTESELTKAAADGFGYAHADLADYPLDDEALAKVPLSLILRHRVVGLSMTATELILGITDPADVMAIDDVRAATGMVVRPVVVARSEVRKIIERLQREGSDFAESTAGEIERSVAEAEELEQTSEDAPVVRYVSSLIEQAIQNRASDLHLEPTENEMRVRYRIDGVLHELDSVPRGVQASLLSRIKIMSNIDITERRIPQNGRVTVRVGRRAVDLRVATLPTVWGEKIVMRVLDTGGVELDINKLGFTEHNFDLYGGAFSKPHGMVLVTGPTGSGKSTTLYATLSAISEPTINIITVEDPVEYRLPGINQVQVNQKAGLTFAAVLPAILRSDPDVVLIGEIRDKDTAQIAVEAALTGHLVLSTLHTNDAPGAITRLTEMGIEPFLVGSSIDCVLAQRLARKLCDWCKVEYAPTAEELGNVNWPVELLGMPERLWRPGGCRSCSATGYRGRAALHEVMRVSQEIEALAVARAPSSEIQKVAIGQGLRTLRVDGYTKCLDGKTSIQEVLRVSV